MKPIDRSSLYLIPASFLVSFGFFELGSSYGAMTVAWEIRSTGRLAFFGVFILTILAIVAGFGLLVRMRGSYYVALGTTAGCLILATIGLIQLRNDMPNLFTAAVPAQTISMVSKWVLLIAVLVLLLLPSIRRSCHSNNTPPARK